MTRTVHTLQGTSGFSFRLEHSAGLADRAREIGELVAMALPVLSTTLGFSPSLRLLVLSREDWPDYATNPVFGMPHCIDGETLVVAASPPEFWDGIRGWAFGPVPRSQMDALSATYGSVGGEIDVRPFNDLMVLHELGHIFHRQVPFDFPRLWIGELFANLCQYVAVAEAMPERVSHLMALPEAIHRSADAVSFTALADFDAHTFEVGLGNFVWYEWQLLFAAKKVYEADGAHALRSLFDASLQCCDRQLTDEELASRLARKLPTVASVMRTWPSVR